MVQQNTARYRARFGPTDRSIQKNQPRAFESGAQTDNLLRVLPQILAKIG